MDLMFEDVAPYLVHERRTHEEGEARAKLIADFLRIDQRCEHVETILRGTHAPGSDVSSCTRFNIYFDEKWESLEVAYLQPGVRYTAIIAVSERGPFVTGGGAEWLPSPDDPKRPSQDRRLHPHVCATAQAKAKDLALAVASKFSLTYLDAEWLRQFKLNPKELTSDVNSSLDYTDPDALNVLFDETL